MDSAVSLVLVLILGACVPSVSVGTPIRASSVDQIKIGQSTKSDVITLFGEPAQQSLTPKGSQATDIWSYNYNQIGNTIVAPFYAKGGEQHSQNLTISFSGNKVIDCIFSESVGSGTEVVGVPSSLSATPAKSTQRRCGVTD